MVWVLPHTKEQEQVVDELLSYLHEQGASGQSFAATTINDKVEKDLIQRFRGLRDEEYAELEENEDGQQKLESWFARIQSRDLVGGERATQAAQPVKSCKKTLEIFTESVYSQE